MLRIVADLGNSRLKWGRIDARGQIVEALALPLDDPAAWRHAWHLWEPTGNSASVWALSSVNPPIAERLAGFLAELPETQTRWYRSAADVPVRHELTRPETTGADRAFAVAAALALRDERHPALAVLCGTAITVERISAEGVWQGGAIAAGLGLTARALHMLTAQLPRVDPREGPPAWGSSTIPAMEAGIYWGTVGGIRELLTRQSKGLAAEPSVFWTGGDAERLATAVDWPGARVVPDLVLRGVALVAFPSES